MHFISLGNAMPNKACTGRWGVCRVFKHFAKCGFEFFLFPSRVHASLSAALRRRTPLGKSANPITHLALKFWRKVFLF